MKTRVKLQVKKQAEPDNRLRGALVLLVEDNRVNQQLAEGMLTKAGIHLWIAENGREALELVKKHDFEAVLMDIHMPEMDGYEATRLMRRDPGLKDLPIIAMTADVTARDKEKSLSSGMNDHIRKPIHVAELYKTLAKWISTSGKRDLIIAVKPGKKNRLTGMIPKTLPGINIEVGLAHMDGDDEAFYILLGTFFEGHQNDINKLRNALAEKNWEVVHRMIHTVKGISGTLGAENLYRVANDLDAVLRYHPEATDLQLVEAFISEMEIIIQGLVASGVTKQVIDVPEAAESSMNTKAVLAELDVLTELLKNMDVDAVEKVRTIQARVSREPETALLKELAQQVYIFEFEKAMDTLERLKQKLQ